MRPTYWELRITLHIMQFKSTDAPTDSLADTPTDALTDTPTDVPRDVLTDTSIVATADTHKEMQ